MRFLWEALVSLTRRSTSSLPSAREKKSFLQLESLEDRVVLTTHALEPHLLFAPGTSQEYIDQFRYADDEGGIGEFQLDARWRSTATDGNNGAGALGNPITLTWSIVPDGTSIRGFAGEASAGSNLVQTFRGIYGITHNASDTDYQGEAWFEAIEASFERWSQVSGVTYVYEANDDGFSLTDARGELGVRGDVRIGGHRIDGNGGTLAYNFYPDVSDMVIDTADSFYNNTASNSLRLRNVIMHEAGHGLGLAHVVSNNASFLMEPSLNTSFDGPQFDDILGAHRGYGDANEAGNGNDSVGNATSLGSLSAGQSIKLGEDATDTTVLSTDIDFVSIDDDSDVDFYSFTVSAGVSIDIILTPLGPTYNEGAQGGSQSPFDSSAQSNLTLQLIGSDGTTIIATANNTGLGGLEELKNIALSASGTYYIKITGAENAAQFYQLDLSVTDGGGGQPGSGVTIVQSNGSTDVSEDGATDTYTIVLDSQPTDDVTITINAGGQLSTDVTSIVFTTSNWNQARTITVSAINDEEIEGDHTGTITHSVSSNDSGYNEIGAPNVTANITDNDSEPEPGVTIVQSNGSTDVSEDGATDTYTLELNTRPTANVTVTIDTGSQLSADVTTVVFTTSNWNQAQTITVSAVDDGDSEGNHTGTISHSVSSGFVIAGIVFGGDPDYNGIAVGDVTVNITDNDTPTPGVSIVQSSGSTNVTEGGATDTYTLVLDSQPTSDVTITINTGSQLNADITTVVFTTSNWNQAQTITISAVDDEDVEGNHTATISHTVTSEDSDYDGISVNSVTVNISDNDDNGTEDDLLYFTVESRTTFGSLTVENEDIAIYNRATDTYSLLFDGSDVGLTGVAIDAFDVISENEILISLDSPSGEIDDADVVLFKADTLGDDTSGSFFKYFDASEAGLTSIGGFFAQFLDFDNVDAVTLLDDGSLLLSTTGDATADGLTFSDEDIIRFVPTSLGSTTSGSFQLYLDGSSSAVGLQNGSEDIDGLAVRDGKLYLTTTGNFSVQGISGSDDDVFVFDKASGSYDSTLFVNFPAGDIRGLDFAGTAGTAGLGFPSGLASGSSIFMFSRIDDWTNDSVSDGNSPSFQNAPEAIRTLLATVEKFAATPVTNSDGSLSQGISTSDFDALTVFRMLGGFSGSEQQRAESSEDNSSTLLDDIEREPRTDAATPKGDLLSQFVATDDNEENGSDDGVVADTPLNGNEDDPYSDSLERLDLTSLL